MSTQFAEDAHTRGGSAEEQTVGKVFRCKSCGFNRKFVVTQGVPANCPSCGGEGFASSTQLSSSEIEDLKTRIAALEAQLPKESA